MALGSLDSNGVGRYAEATPIGASFSGYMNEGLLSVSAALTTLLAKRAILGFRAANQTAMSALAGMSAGDMCYRSDNGITYRYSGAAWKRWDSDWLSLANNPALTGMVIGSGGTNQVNYKFDGGRCRLRWRLIFGSSGNTYPTTPSIMLPTGVDPGGAVVLRTPAIANEFMESINTIFDSGVSVNRGYAAYDGTNTDRVRLIANAGTTGGTASISTTSPITFGTGDGFAGEAIFDIV